MTTIKKILGVLAFFMPNPFNKYVHKIRGVKIANLSTFIISFGSIIDNVFPEKISIGEHCTISTNVKIYAHTGPPETIQKKYMPFVVKEVKIGNNVYIGTGAVILPGVTIGDWVMIGAGCVVTKDVEDYAIVAGNPARKIRDIRERDITHYAK